MPNISQLDDTAFSVDSLRIEGGPVTMKLGGHEFTFEDGQWVVGAFNYLIHIVSDLLLDHVPLHFCRQCMRMSYKILIRAHHIFI